jgi:hypothetical protein
VDRGARGHTTHLEHMWLYLSTPQFDVTVLQELLVEVSSVDAELGLVGSERRSKHRVIYKLHLPKYPKYLPVGGRTCESDLEPYTTLTLHSIQHLRLQTAWIGNTGSLVKDDRLWTPVIDIFSGYRVPAPIRMHVPTIDRLNIDYEELKPSLTVRTLGSTHISRIKIWLSLRDDGVHGAMLPNLISPDAPCGWRMCNYKDTGDSVLEVEYAGPIDGNLTFTPPHRNPETPPFSLDHLLERSDLVGARGCFVSVAHRESW